MQGIPAAVKKAIVAITDLEHLDEPRLWLLDATSW
jgi:hypothetical protein